MGNRIYIYFTRTLSDGTRVIAVAMIEQPAKRVIDAKAAA